MTPIEKAARAACRSYLETDYEGEDLDALVEKEWPEHTPTARAVLLAIREPSAEMVDAGRDVGPAAPYGLHEVRERWETMIDKALEEG